MGSTTLRTSGTHYKLDYATVTLALKQGTTTLRSATGSGGALSVAHTTAAAPTGAVPYSWVVTNSSADLAAGYSLAWSTTTLGAQADTGQLGAAPASVGHSVEASDAGPMTVTGSWQRSAHSVPFGPWTAPVSAGAVSMMTIAPDASGTITAALAWTPASAPYSGTVEAAGLNPQLHPFSIDAPGPISMNLRWPKTTIANPELIIELWDDSGPVSGATTTRDAGTTSENSATLTYSAPSPGAYPATKAYQLKVSSVATSGGSSYTIEGTTPRYPVLRLELDDASGVERASDTTIETALDGTPRLSLSYAGGTAQTYKLWAVSTDTSSTMVGSTTATFTGTHPRLDYAELTIAVKSASTTLDSITAYGGSFSFTAALPSAGAYSIVITNTSGDLSVPSYTTTTTRPVRREGSAALSLLDAGGAVVATASAANPARLIATGVAPGAYDLVVTPVAGAADGRLTATYPGYPSKLVIGYDGNDHATTVDDGKTTTHETLSPSGRVIQRRVKDSISKVVSEDVIYGYAGDGDSPSYTRPAAGGPLTTYLGGPGGLLAIDVAGVATWPLANGHGDIIGRTTAAGAFTPDPLADEFGVATATNPDRLGWLGAHQRYSVGGSLGLIRMGVRLYDPAVGRFHQVDPVEGGNDNDYEYCGGDPVGCLDLDGQINFKKWWKKHGNTVITAAGIAACAASAGACLAVGAATVAYNGIGRYKAYKAGKMSAVPPSPGQPSTSFSLGSRGAAVYPPRMRDVMARGLGVRPSTSQD